MFVIGGNKSLIGNKARCPLCQLGGNTVHPPCTHCCRWKQSRTTGKPRGSTSTTSSGYRVSFQIVHAVDQLIISKTRWCHRDYAMWCMCFVRTKDLNLGTGKRHSILGTESENLNMWEQSGKNFSQPRKNLSLPTRVRPFAWKRAKVQSDGAE